MSLAQSCSWLFKCFLLSAAVSVCAAARPGNPPDGSEHDPYYLVLNSKPKAKCDNSAQLVYADELISQGKWEEAQQVCFRVRNASCNKTERFWANSCLENPLPFPFNIIQRSIKPPVIILPQLPDDCGIFDICSIVPTSGWQRFLWWGTVIGAGTVVWLLLWWLPWNIWLLVCKWRFGQRWVVWSVQDESKSGASGAVMDALNLEANPLLEPLSASNKEKRKANSPLTNGRPSLLLKPPLLHKLKEPTTRPHGVWGDFVSRIPADTDDDCFPIEQIADPDNEPKKNLIRFWLAPAYTEIDIAIGKVPLKGINQLFKIYKRYLNSCCPSVNGIVSQVQNDGKKAWAVRLNASQGWMRHLSRKMRTFSVYADGSLQEYNDPLLAVAQRAALRLVIRMLNPGMEANNAIARACYQQGIQQLRQIL